MLFSQSFALSQPLVTKLFSAAVSTGKLANAYLLAGNVWDDKWQLALELAYYLNCSQVKTGASTACALANKENGIATGGDHTPWCTNCRWLVDGQHPQALLKLSGEQSKSGKITVEQARALVGEISKTSAYTRVVVIEEAGQEALHRPAANTLLKTIEEPRTNVLLIFCAQAINDVLATIISRCQVINMSNNMYKEQKFYSLFAGNKKISEFVPDSLLLGDKEQKERTFEVIEKFTNVDCQFVDAINLADNIQLLIKEKEDLESVLDFFVTKELLGLQNFSTLEKEARYARELFLLSQIAKEQSKHYVGQKAVIETFVFAWYKLKQTGVNPLKVRG